METLELINKETQCDSLSKTNTIEIQGRENWKICFEDSSGTSFKIPFGQSIRETLKDQTPAGVSVS